MNNWFIQVTSFMLQVGGFGAFLYGVYHLGWVSNGWFMIAAGLCVMFWGNVRGAGK